MTQPEMATSANKRVRHHTELSQCIEHVDERDRPRRKGTTEVAQVRGNPAPPFAMSMRHRLAFPLHSSVAAVDNRLCVSPETGVQRS